MFLVGSRRSQNPQPSANMKISALLSTVLIFGLAVTAHAQVINLTHVKNSENFYGGAVDPVTGKFYQVNTYYGATNVAVFADAADFANNVVEGSVALTGAVYGTYFEVNNGSIYGRTNQSSTSIARWDASSGLVQNSVASVPGMGGSNFYFTFNWGGFSGVNFLQDTTGLYLFGKNDTGVNWQLNRMDATLGILETKQYTANTLGYGFMVNGNLFTSNSYNSNTIDSVMNFATGVQSAVNFTLSGVPSPYWNNTFYDVGTDTLYFHDSTGGDFWKVGNASAAFNVPISDIPEPATVGLLGLLGLLGYLRVRRKAKLSSFV